LLRGGYRKTHFQADETTLNFVSTIGISVNKKYNKIWENKPTTRPKINFENKLNVPESFPFEEKILQVLIKEYIKNNTNNILNDILNHFNINENPNNFETLSEKALSSGHVDLLIKRKHPIGKDYKIIIEVKKNKSGKKDVEQLAKYMGELEDCIGGILVAKDFAKTCFKQISKINKKILFISYDFENLDITKDYIFQDLLDILNLNIKYQPSFW
jgi:RecB family endonuclease NucS